MKDVRNQVGWGEGRWVVQCGHVMDKGGSSVAHVGIGIAPFGFMALYNNC